MGTDTGFERYQLLQHVARYRMATPKSFEEQFGRLGDVKSAIKRLLGDKLIESARLYPGTDKAIYYHLTPEGAQKLGLKPTLGQPIIKQDVRARRFGVLLFCFYGPMVRPLFLAHDFAQCFPELLAKDSPLARRFDSDFYFLHQDKHGYRRLGRIMIDPGNPVFAKKVQDAARIAEECYPELVLHDRFIFGLVTAHEEAATRLRVHTLKHHPPFCGNREVPCIVEHYPELAPFLVPKKAQDGS